MTKTARLRICGPVSIHGQKPGQDFEVPADTAGVPLDLLWRKRLADGSCVSTNNPLPADQPAAQSLPALPEPAPAPAASKKKDG